MWDTVVKFWGWCFCSCTKSYHAKNAGFAEICPQSHRQRGRGSPTDLSCRGEEFQPSAWLLGCQVENKLLSALAAAVYIAEVNA